MNGIDASTGKNISGLAHLRQSVRDILSTPIGTRVLRRDYGSRLPRLVVNGGAILDHGSGGIVLSRAA
jgi:Bacteriophage baseplate protein W